MNLADEQLAASNPTDQPLNPAEVAQGLAALPDWTARTVGSTPRLEKRFVFADFAQALAFTNRVGALAERDNHHPSILTEWGKVTVSWWTHSLGGIHRNDLIMAARTDRLAS